MDFTILAVVLLIGVGIPVGNVQFFAHFDSRIASR